MATMTQMTRELSVLDVEEIKGRVLPEGAATRAASGNRNLLLAGVQAILAKLREMLKNKKITAQKLLMIFLATETYYREVKSILNEGD